MIADTRLPNAQISYFSTFPDMEAALKAEKIDGFPGDGLVVRMMAAEDSSLFVMDEKLRSYDCGVVLPKNEKGDRLGKELNEWIAEAKKTGELDAMVDKWVEAPEEERTIPDYMSFPATNGVLKVTTEGTFPPMNYYRGEELVGMELGVIFQKELYTKQSGANKGKDGWRLNWFASVPAQDIRNGEFTVPAEKDSRKKQNGAAAPAGGAVYDDIDV